MLDNIRKHWWVLALRGVFALIFGFIAIFSPGIVFITLLFYFGFVAVLSGIVIIIEGIASKDGDKGLKIVEGLVSIVFGILFITHPGFIISFMLYVVAFWAIMSGIFQIYNAVKLRKIIENELYSILNGAVSLIFGLMILFNVVASAEALIMVFGFFAVISGMLLIALSFKVKGLNKAG
jgi:uncharacterized membrane protein HdeD (DUF308 family)